MYAGERNVFQDKEVALLEEAAAAISFTLERLDRESQHQREEEALRESEERYRRLFEVESDAIVMAIDDTGRFLDANAAALQLYGYKRDESSVCKPPTYRPNPIRPECPSPPARTRFPFAWHRKKDGTVFPVEIDVSYFACQGRTVHVVAIRDISQRKRVEDDLHAATRAAQAANRAKSEFLANMSHEIRTPMTAILGFSDLLMTQNCRTSEQCEFLETIRRNGKALLELIGDILDLSQIEADKLTLEKIDCPLQQIIDDVLAVVQVRREAKAAEHGGRLPFSASRSDPYRSPPPPPNPREPGGQRRQVHRTRRSAHRRPLPGPSGRRPRKCSSPSPTPASAFPPKKSATSSALHASRRLGQSPLRRHGSRAGHLQAPGHALGGDIEVASEPGKGSTFTLTIDAGSACGVPMLAIAAGPALGR